MFGPSDGPLRGTRVLDLTQALAGPFATMILADLGAEVVKVESPGGDLTRSTPPYDIDGTSLYFLANNRNKRGIVLDLKQPRALGAFYDLVREADVVIYNFSLGVVERLRIDPGTLRERNPRLVVCNVTGYGSRGPGAGRRAVDPIVQALAGAMSITGHPGEDPARAGIPTADLSTGLYAAIGILAALNERNATGRGASVETSLFHSQLSLLNYMATYCAWSGVDPQPVGSGHPGTVPSQAFQAKDGWIVIDAGFDRHFRLLCEAIGQPKLADEARFRTRPDRLRARKELNDLIGAAVAKRPVHAWIEKLDALGVPCGRVRSVSEALRSDESVTYASMRPIDYGGATFGAMGTPLWFAGRETHAMRSPPRLGEATAAVLAEWARYSPEQVAEVTGADA